MESRSGRHSSSVRRESEFCADIVVAANDGGGRCKGCNSLQTSRKPGNVGFRKTTYNGTQETTASGRDTHIPTRTTRTAKSKTHRDSMHVVAPQPNI